VFQKHGGRIWKTRRKGSPVQQLLFWGVYRYAPPRITDKKITYKNIIGYLN